MSGSINRDAVSPTERSIVGPLNRGYNRLSLAANARPENCMNCRSCHARLQFNDNYCRKCGAAVDIVDVEVIRTSQSRQVSTIRAAAVPVVAQGATVILAGTLLRFAIRQFLGRHEAIGRSLIPFGRRGAPAGDVVEEVLYYRRSRAR